MEVSGVCLFIVNSWIISRWQANYQESSDVIKPAQNYVSTVDAPTDKYSKKTYCVVLMDYQVPILTSIGMNPSDDSLHFHFQRL
jgi:hypothetical protein